MSHAFISYVREDQARVSDLANELTNRGVEVWLDRNEIYPGTPWQYAIRKAIENGNYFIACFSKAYATRKKTSMNEELNIAIDEIRKRHYDAVFFIPVLIDKCDMPGWAVGAGRTLRDFQWVNLYEDWNKGIERIASVVLEEDKKK